MFCKSVYRAGKIYAVANDAVNWFGDSEDMTSIRIVRVSVDPFQSKPSIDRVFGSNNAFDDNPDQRFYYGFPAIEVGKEENMVIVYVRSGVDAFPEIRFSAWYKNDGDILSSRRLKAGEKAYLEAGLAGWPNLPWADISGASVDPVDDSSVWIASCYTNSAADRNWGVWVGKVKL